jgi:hypothetical protein
VDRYLVLREVTVHDHAPSVLDPVRNKARAVLRTGWRPPFADGPSGAELADAILQSQDRNAA